MSIYVSNSVFQRLDLSLLRYFFAVASFGGFSKASRATGISQPALSLGLQKLERALGTRLIDRKSGGFSLTDSGRVLDAFCKRLEGGLESMLGDLGSGLPSAPRRLRIGAALSVGLGPLFRLCLENTRSKEPMELELTAQNTFQLLEALKEGSLEAALVPDDIYDRHIEITPLFRDKLIFVHCRFQGDLFKKKRSATALLKTALITYPRETPMRSLVDQICGKHQLRFSSMVAVNGLDAIIGLVKQGAGGAFVLRSLVSEELRKEELYEARLPFTLPYSGVVLATAAGENGRGVVKVMRRLLRPQSS